MNQQQKRCGVVKTRLPKPLDEIRGRMESSSPQRLLSFRTTSSITLLASVVFFLSLCETFSFTIND